jgi:hypothetical protein
MSTIYVARTASGKHTRPDAAPAQPRATQGLPDRSTGAAEPPSMWLLRILVGLTVLSSCHLRAGYDAAARATGPLQAVMAQAQVSRTTGVVELPPDHGHNYAVEAGFGNATFTLNGLLAIHDVTSTSFTAGAGTLTATLGANVRWSVLRWHGLSPSLAAGPARVMVLDRTTGERTWGNGLRFAAGAYYRYGPIAVYAEGYREVVAFSGGPATGTSTLDGLGVGLVLQP